MTLTVYPASTQEITQALATIASARTAFQAGEPPSIDLLLRLNQTLALIARWRRPEDDLLLSLTSELEALRDRLQQALAVATRDLKMQAANHAAMRAYATPADRSGR